MRADAQIDTAAEVFFEHLRPPLTGPSTSTRKSAPRFLLVLDSPVRIGSLHGTISTVGGMQHASHDRGNTGWCRIALAHCIPRCGALLVAARFATEGLKAMLRIITEYNTGHWTAWTEDHPETTFGGDRPSVAVGRLVESMGLDPNTIGVEDASGERLTFRIPSNVVCPDCNGSGKYVRLSAVEPCAACGGTGHW